MINRLIIILLFITPLLWGCSSQLCLQKRTDYFIENHQRNTDTIYLYSSAFNDFNLVWYHKDCFIHSFMIKPHRTKYYASIKIKNITLDDNDIDICFENFLNKNNQCFESVLDGAWIMVYIKNREPLNSSIDLDCLFNTKFQPKSFPYKLQYDLFKLGLSPTDFNFEEFYIEKNFDKK